MNHKTVSIKAVLNGYLPPILWAGIIFAFSSQSVLPTFKEIGYDFFLKKLAHIFVYLVLFLLFDRAAQLTMSNQKSKLRIWMPVLLCLGYAISDEIHQSFVPGRFATLRDIGYDMLGVGLAFLKKYGYI